MFKTNASIRRFLKGQERYGNDAPDTLWDRYQIYVWAVSQDSSPKSFKEWLND